MFNNYRNTIATLGHGKIFTAESPEDAADQWSDKFTMRANDELVNMDDQERTDLEMTGHDWVCLRMCEIREEFLDGLEQVYRIVNNSGQFWNGIGWGVVYCAEWYTDEPGDITCPSCGCVADQVDDKFYCDDCGNGFEWAFAGLKN